jgi:hypothetical protein
MDGVRKKVSGGPLQGKAFNSGHVFGSACGCLGEGQLIRELKLGEVDHHRMRKQVKTMYLPESTYHREIFPPQREVDTT